MMFDNSYTAKRGGERVTDLSYCYSIVNLREAFGMMWMPGFAGPIFFIKHQLAIWLVPVFIL